MIEMIARRASMLPMRRIRHRAQRGERRQELSCDATTGVSQLCITQATRKTLINNSVEIIDDGERPRAHKDVYMWGYNAYGELGLGDNKIRLTPTLVTALAYARVHSLSLGDRHTLCVTDHVPMLVKDVPDLKPFFDIIKVPCFIFIPQRCVPD